MSERDSDLVEELCALEEGLTTWELDFVESIALQVEGAKRPLSPAQRDKAEQILRRLT